MSRKGHGPLKLEYRPSATLKPYKNNPIDHPPAQIDALARMIKGPVGFTKPIIIDEKLEILAGHGAWLAAQQAGVDPVPTVMRAGLTPAQKKAYRIFDNRIGEDHKWLDPVLAQEFTELQRMGFDMSQTGFNHSEIEFMLAPPPADPGEPPVPAAKKRITTVLGDMWLLGESRIICGDSTKPATYKTLMGGRQAQCIYTDPPYGISYKAPSGLHEVIKGDDLRRGQLAEMLNHAFACARANSREDAGWYIWHASGTRDDFAHAMRQIGLVELSLIIWEKPGATLGWGDYRQAHEPCFYAALQGVKPAFHGDRTGATVWRLEGTKAGPDPTSIGSGLIITGPDGQEIYLSTAAPKGKKVRHIHLEAGKPVLISPKSDVDNVWAVSRDVGHGKDNAIHPTQKPVELARRACRNSALEGEIVLDMFAGSGSTLMAAEQTKRLGYGIELDPTFVDAIVRRWQDMTGKKATHAKEKKSFEAITEARGKA